MMSNSKMLQQYFFPKNNSIFYESSRVLLRHGNVTYDLTNFSFCPLWYVLAQWCKRVLAQHVLIVICCLTKSQLKNKHGSIKTFISETVEIFGKFQNLNADSLETFIPATAASCCASLRSFSDDHRASSASDSSLGLADFCELLFRLKSCILGSFVFLFSGIGTGVGSHRFFSHRSFKATRGFKIFLIFCQTVSGEVVHFNSILMHFCDRSFKISVQHPLLGEDSSHASQVLRHRSRSNEHQTGIFLLIRWILFSSATSGMPTRVGSNRYQRYWRRQGHDVSV